MIQLEAGMLAAEAVPKIETAFAKVFGTEKDYLPGNIKTHPGRGFSP